MACFYSGLFHHFFTFLLVFVATPTLSPLMAVSSGPASMSTGNTVKKGRFGVTVITDAITVGAQQKSGSVASEDNKSSVTDCSNSSGVTFSSNSSEESGNGELGKLTVERKSVETLNSIFAIERLFRDETQHRNHTHRTLSVDDEDPDHERDHSEDWNELDSILKRSEFLLLLLN